MPEQTNISAVLIQENVEIEKARIAWQASAVLRPVDEELPYGGFISIDVYTNRTLKPTVRLQLPPSKNTPYEVWFIREDQPGRILLGPLTHEKENEHYMNVTAMSVTDDLREYSLIYVCTDRNEHNPHYPGEPILQGVMKIVNEL